MNKKLESVCEKLAKWLIITPTNQKIKWHYVNINR